MFKRMTSVSKNFYFDVLDDIVNKYNNTVPRTIKMTQLTLHLILMLHTMKILMKPSLNLKSVIVAGYRNTKIFLLKDTLKIGQKKFSSLLKLRIQFRGHTRLVI